MAPTPGWGYSCIIGEPRKLGILAVFRTTVRTLLKERAIEPALDRDEPKLNADLKRQACNHLLVTQSLTHGSP